MTAETTTRVFKYVLSKQSAMEATDYFHASPASSQGLSAMRRAFGATQI